MDRDILQIDILLRRSNIDAAKDLYKYGRNMVTEESVLTSLQSLAKKFDYKTSAEDEQRLYTYFEEYYGNNPDYADKLVVLAFEGDKDGVQFAIRRTLQTIVLPHNAIHTFFEAVYLCEENNLEKSFTALDKGVAVLVGSLEGKLAGGSSDGLSWFSLAKEFCAEFNCGDILNPPANRRMMEHFGNIKSNMDNGKCIYDEFLVDEMESLLLVPIIQGLLYFSKMRQDNPDIILYYETAKVFAQAIIPVVKKVSVSESFAIESIISSNIGDPVDAERVWTAIFNVIDDGSDKLNLGVACEDIGNPKLIMNGETFCNYVGGS